VGGLWIDSIPVQDHLPAGQTVEPSRTLRHSKKEIKNTTNEATMLLKTNEGVFGSHDVIENTRDSRFCHDVIENTTVIGSKKNG
jgi:hypothetical protein